MVSKLIFFQKYWPASPKNHNLKFFTCVGKSTKNPPFWTAQWFVDGPEMPQSAISFKIRRYWNLHFFNSICFIFPSMFQLTTFCFTRTTFLKKIGRFVFYSAIRSLTAKVAKVLLIQIHFHIPTHSFRKHSFTSSFRAYNGGKILLDETQREQSLKTIFRLES